MDARSTIIAKVCLIGLITVAISYFYGINKLANRKFELIVNGNEIYTSLRKTGKTTAKVKKLLIGDSVAKQLYDNNMYNDSIYSLACNQAISMIGHYILLKKFIQNNPDQKPAVHLIFHPQSFQNDLDQKYTFHYFLKPFYISPNKSELIPHAQNQIKKIPYYWLSQFPPIKTNNWSPSYNPEKKREEKFYLSETSRHYLKKIYELCHDNQLQLHCAPTVVKESYRDYDFETLKKEISQCGLNTLFENYIDNLIYVKDDQFSDEIHLSDPSLLGYNPLNF